MLTWLQKLPIRSAFVHHSGARLVFCIAPVPLVSDRCLFGARDLGTVCSPMTGVPHKECG